MTRLRALLLLLSTTTTVVATLQAQGPTLPDATATETRPDRRPAAEAAYRAGWMPLIPTGVPAFAQQFPAADGRGVLIAILDSGIDPSIPGLTTLPDGGPKLLDLRDFSGEGRIALSRAERDGDSLRVGRRVVGGASRLAALAAGPVWGGVLAEVDLGKAPAADINGDGAVDDSLLVLVARGPGGWMVFADRHGDGGIADDAPVRDYAIAREWLGWAPGGAAPALGIAVNVRDSAGTPLLDLFFDSSSHGSHVAGIAAGHNMYGIIGFDGVAPGATLLGLKIANNADGGITVPGSMLKALAHAVGVARERRMPLVVNLSFGVGNEAEGAADIDALVDSVLKANADVVMTVAASNDGPGLSTLGFPGSAIEVLSVGATQPLVFSGLAPADQTPDPIAYFSSRGAELAGPDLVAPGTAYSTVPQFAIGDEQNSGTSMAAPHVAGLAARLVGRLQARGAMVRRSAVNQALRVSSLPVPGATILDQGAGVPDLLRADRWLEAYQSVPVIVAAGGKRRGRAGIVHDGKQSSLVHEITLRRLDAAAALPVRLRLDAPWVSIDGPTELTVDGHGTVVRVRINPDSLPPNGTRLATLIVAHATDEGLGQLAAVPITVRVPISEAQPDGITVRAAPGAAARVPFLADTGRGLRIEIATLAANQLALAALHEPGGQPFRDGSVTTAGYQDGGALFEIDAGDVVAGMYEAIVVAPPTGSTAAKVTVERSPVRLGAVMVGDSLEVAATSLAKVPVELRLRAAITGAMQSITASGDGRQVVRVAIAVPSWAVRIAIDATMPMDLWPGFTDFGVTLRERDGTMIGEGPLNYAFGRMVLDLDPRTSGDTLVLHLSPAPAVPGAALPWSLNLTIRHVADRPSALDDGGTGRATLAPAAVRRARFAVARWPLEIPAGFFPLITVVALEGDDAVWTRELPLRGAGGPNR